MAAEELGQHDLLLFLPAGPLHIRLHISSHGKTLPQARSEYVMALIAKLDVDADGKLSREETAKHPLFVTGRRFEKNEFLDSLRQSRHYELKEISAAIDRSAGQMVTYRQNDSLAEQDLSVFNVLDTDKSGLIDPIEMRMSPARIADRDFDHDQCITFDEFLSEAMVTDTTLLSTISSEPPTAMHSELLRNANEPLMPARLVRRYDLNKDAHLSATELGWSAERLSVLDKDQNDRLSPQELGSLPNCQPDVSLSVDLGSNASDAMKQLEGSGDDVQSIQSDLIRINRDSTSVSIGYRWRDPMKEAELNARSTFNAIDTDSNGYLDRTEIVGHQRFELYLFDAMDRDSDDRVFAQEMTSYVQEYTEPESTACQITLFDTGNGFFQVLDVNGDGRISIRELRKCEQRLQAIASEDANINPSKAAKSYRMEIQRGGVGLFGRVDRPTQEIPATLLRQTGGPKWFQRMDRNGDGDLTWDEFLGPRETFHELDRDHDDLIDKDEAELATNKRD